jgi:hypothetical protein
MKKNLFFILCMVFFSYAIQAQDGPVLKFEKMEHDFGKIKEEGGSVTYTYKFTNAGNKPLKIDKVQPACGCTTPDWTKEEVKPGKEGFVKATFDPNGRPGNFHKSVTVYANTQPNISVLTFKGDVIPRTKTVEDSFPSVSGNLRYVLNHINYGAITNNVKDTVQYLSLMNVGTKPITIKEIKGDAAAYVTSKKLPFVVPVRKEVKLPIHYNATVKKDYGLIFDQLKLVTDDEKELEKPISVIADIRPYIPVLSEAEKAKAPKIEFVKKMHDFGEIKQGEDVITNFSFTNKGKQELQILKVKSTCGCTAPEPAKTVLKPGETSDIKVTYHSAGKSGKEKKDVTVYTNDPLNPEIILSIYANVTVPAPAK